MPESDDKLTPNVPTEREHSGPQVVPPGGIYLFPFPASNQAQPPAPTEKNASLLTLINSGFCLLVLGSLLSLHIIVGGLQKEAGFATENIKLLTSSVQGLALQVGHVEEKVSALKDKLEENEKRAGERHEELKALLTKKSK